MRVALSIDTDVHGSGHLKYKHPFPDWTPNSSEVLVPYRSEKKLHVHLKHESTARLMLNVLFLVPARN